MVRKSSKKGWKAVKLTEELQVRAEQDHLAEMVAKGDSLFTEDVSGKGRGVSKSVRQAVGLLNKSSASAASISEADLIRKYIAKAAKGETTKSRVVPNKRAPLKDLWETAPEKKLKTLVVGSISKRESFAPGVLPASAALSVNPSESVLEQAILEEATMESKKSAPKGFYRKFDLPEISNTAEEHPDSTDAAGTTEVGAVGVSERKTKAQKLKEARHKQMLKEHENRRREKHARRLMQDKASRLAREAELAAEREQRLKVQAKRIVAEAAGQFTLARGAGGRIANRLEQIPTEIASSLRRMVPMGDPVLERRQSLLKRRMIEQVPELNNEYKEKVRFAQLHPRKTARLTDKDAKARCVLLG